MVQLDHTFAHHADFDIDEEVAKRHIIYGPDGPEVLKGAVPELQEDSSHGHVIYADGCKEQFDKYSLVLDPLKDFILSSQAKYIKAIEAKKKAEVVFDAQALARYGVDGLDELEEADRNEYNNSKIEFLRKAKSAMTNALMSSYYDKSEVYKRAKGAISVANTLQALDELGERVELGAYFKYYLLLAVGRMSNENKAVKKLAYVPTLSHKRTRKLHLEQGVEILRNGDDVVSFAECEVKEGKIISCADIPGRPKTRDNRDDSLDGREKRKSSAGLEPETAEFEPMINRDLFIRAQRAFSKPRLLDVDSDKYNQTDRSSKVGVFKFC